MSNIKTTISADKGVYSEYSSGFSITSQNPTSSSILVVDNTGVVHTSTKARMTKYEFYQNFGNSQTIITGSYTLIQINGAAITINSGMNTWNTSSYVWKPAENNAVYTLRLEAELPANAGNNTIQFNFCMSGTSPDAPTLAQREHLVSADYLVRNNITPHGHFHMSMPIFVNDDLFTSGGIFLAATTGGSIVVQSASLMIKEG